MIVEKCLDLLQVDLLASGASLFWPRSGDNESRKRRGEREKPLVTLTSNLTSMQTTAVKRVKLLIKRVTNGNLANTCLSAAIFLSEGRPGEIML